MNARLKTPVLALLVCALMTAAFLAYLRPGFVLDLANQLWLCL